MIGGPEVSYEQTEQSISQYADFVVSGEADLLFPELCQQILDGTTPPDKFLDAPLPSLDALQLPYELYTDEDLAHRVVYVEASRGCPFTCEFCLSALEIPVRLVDIDAFLSAMQRAAGPRCPAIQVCRSYVQSEYVRVSKKILQFFLDRYVDGIIFALRNDSRSASPTIFVL